MTRRSIALISLIVALGLVPSLRAQQNAAPPKTDDKPAASIDGSWNIIVTGQQNPVEAVAVFKTDAKKLTGNVTGPQGEVAVTGEYADGKVTFTMPYSTNNGPIQLNFVGAMKDDGTLAGTLSSGQTNLAWTATRQKDKAGAKTIDIAGKWTMTLEMSTGTGTPTLTLKVDGEKVTGTYAGRYGQFPISGTLKGNAIEFAFTMTAEGSDVDMSFEGEVAADGQSISGSAVLGPLGDASWTAKRAK